MNRAADGVLARLYGGLRAAHDRRSRRRAGEIYELHPTFRFSGTSISLYGLCRISHNVRIYTSSVSADSDLLDELNVISKTGNVTIGDGVWIGYGVFIGPGIFIGDGAVVGANSVVTKDVPPNAIVGGVPAKLIRMKSTSIKLPAVSDQ